MKYIALILCVLSIVISIMIKDPEFTTLGCTFGLIALIISCYDNIMYKLNH